jgi:heme exporter protein C
MQQFANPRRFLGLALIEPWAWSLSQSRWPPALSLVAAPQDYQQRDGPDHVRPCPGRVDVAARLFAMAAASAIAIIFRHPRRPRRQAAAPIGACFTFLALATGSLWGS